MDFKYSFVSQNKTLQFFKETLGVQNPDTLRVLCVGDVVGKGGTNVCSQLIPELKKELSLDFVLANGENSANDGRGLSPESFAALKNSGVDVVTTGNHVWRHDKIYSTLNTDPSVVRPLNFLDTCPGKGYTIIQVGEVKVGIVNLLGRTFIREHTDCPFLALEKVLETLKQECKIILVDLHAEATSEKVSLGMHFDGKVSAVFGTHTHVQTSDARIMPNGTGFLTDLGSVCSLNSCLGMAKEEVLAGFLTQMPTRFKVESSMPVIFSGAIFDFSVQTGKCLNVCPLRIECS